MEEILLYFAIKYDGDWDKIYLAINKKEKVDTDELRRVVSNCNSSYITILSSNYPSKLKNIYKPPFVLFYKGNIELLYSNNKVLAVVGSRKNSSYGKYVTEKIVSEVVKEDVIIVSGLAKGIDSIAHDSCIRNFGKTIAILGCGINYCYPKENIDLYNNIEDKGLIISEYPNLLEPNKEFFPRRNRIIAGLSDGVLVTESKINSGSMITVNRALEMGKEIFCIPYLIGENSGCNSLIKEGAKLIECGKDILNEI